MGSLAIVSVGRTYVPWVAAGFWEKLVALRAAVLRLLGPVGWIILGVLFMAVVVALMRAGGKADASEL